MSVILSLSGVHRIYNVGKLQIHAIKGLDFTVDSGETVAIFGPSGCGKSTLLNILGLIDKPSKGDVLFDGKSFHGYGDDKLAACRAKNIGFVFQNFHLIPVLSALDNVMLPLLIANVSNLEARERAISTLIQVSMVDFANHRPNQLSGGQCQRVAIARALVTKPKLIIADEPTANLDSESAAQVMDLLRALSQEQNLTCIFSTHDKSLLSRVARHVFLRDGYVVYDRKNESLFTS